MTINLIKLCVGIEDVDQLVAYRAQTVAEAGRLGKPAENVHVTRSFPRRASEVLDDGSLYWVIKGFIRCRQPILELREHIKDDGKKYCGIVMLPEVIRTELQPFRPFQGWRYLEPSSSPRDISNVMGGVMDLPDHMADELKGLGLI